MFETWNVVGVYYGCRVAGTFNVDDGAFWIVNSTMSSVFSPKITRKIIIAVDFPQISIANETDHTHVRV